MWCCESTYLNRIIKRKESCEKLVVCWCKGERKGSLLVAFLGRVKEGVASDSEISRT